MKHLIIIFTFICASTYGLYQDWFSEGILSLSGLACKKNESISKFFLIPGKTSFFYLDNSLPEKIPSRTTLAPSAQIRFGVTNFMDFEFILRGLYQHSGINSSYKVSDTSIRAGFTLLRPKTSINHSALRFVIQQDFPTGHFKNLNPIKKDIGVSGFGYYTTQLYLCYHTTQSIGERLMRLTIDFGPGFSPPSCLLENYNLYGGGPGTLGHLKGVAHFNLITNLVYTITQNVCFISDIGYFYSSKGSFYGKSSPIPTKRPVFKTLSLTPGFQVNFNKNFSLNLCSYFSVFGKNSAQFNSAAIELIYKK